VVSSDHLAPGAVGQIKATVDTAGRSGYVAKHINVYSNDRLNPVLSLTIMMDIVGK